MAEEGAKDLSILNREFGATYESETADEQYFTYRDEDVTLEHLALPLMGRHQLGNAAIAVRAALMFGLEEEAIRAGLAKTV